MYKAFSLILCLLACASAVEAQKGASRRRADSAVEREFGAAARAYEKREREKARREEQRARAGHAVPTPEQAPLPTPATTAPVSRAAQFNPALLPPFTVHRTPDAYKRRHSDPHRALNPRKVRDRRARGHDDNLKNQYMFPVETGAVVYDAQGRRLGRLAPTVRLRVDGVTQQVPQQIRINKNEGQFLRLPGRRPEKFEMAPGIQLTNGRHVSGLVRRADIPAPDRPRPARPRRPPAPRGETIPFYITGNQYGPHPRLVGTDPRTGRRVPLRFLDPRTNRGYTGPHRAGNDYLPRPIGTGPSNSAYYVNLVGDRLPGSGGIARTVVRIDKNDPTPPIIDVYTRRAARSRDLYLPGRRDPQTSLVFVQGRLRGAGRDLGRVFIATPNLSPLPAPARRR